MRRPFALSACAALLAGGALTHGALADPPPLPAPDGVTASVAERSVHVGWDGYAFPPGTAGDALVVLRDGQPLATLPEGTTSYADATAGTGTAHTYAVRAVASRGGHPIDSPPSAPASVTLPGYLVGAAQASIAPDGVVNLGGFGLGDGSFIPEQVTERGGRADGSGSGIKARALVVGDGADTVAIADIETQGMFAAYAESFGPVGLHDMAVQVEKDLHGALAVDHILIASDHTHHGPDTIGAWGGVDAGYLAYVKQQTVAAIEQAYQQRRYADIVAGESDASDLIYNQGCTEALDHGDDITAEQYPSSAPEVCPVPGKDGMVRVLQARTPGDAVVATLMVYAAHSTTNMGSPVDGDWPQFLGDHFETAYGGIGIGMEGANGGTQPCRPDCWFTSKDNPGHGLGRFHAIVANYSAHVTDALAHAKPVTGPVAAAQRMIREPIVGPFVNALFVAGAHTGTHLMRATSPPWMVGQTVGTVASVVRVGNVLFNGTPGEGFAAIRQGVADAVHEKAGGPLMVVQLGLANDQLGYLIAPAAYTAPIAAEAAVNDNILFNVSPTIGDHVMCSDIDLAAQLVPEWQVAVPPTCQPYLAMDATESTVEQIPVGGVTLP